VHRAEVARVALAVEEDETPGPIDVALFRAPRVVPDAQDVAELVEEARGLAAGPGPEVAAEPLGELADVGSQLGQGLARDDFVKEGECGAGLDLGGRGQLGLPGEVVEERGHLGAAQLLGVPQVVEVDVAAGPGDEGLPEGRDVAAGAEGVREAVEQPGRRGGRGLSGIGKGRHDWTPPGRRVCETWKNAQFSLVLVKCRPFRGGFLP